MYRPVLYLEQGASETRVCLRLHVEPTQLDPIDGATLYLQREFSHWNIVCQIEDTTMDVIQNCNSYNF
jgi:hypothetical protein